VEETLSTETFTGQSQRENMQMGVLHKIIHISKLDNKFIILQIELHNLNILMDYQSIYISQLKVIH